MPEFPEPKTETTSTSNKSMFNPNIPVFNSLSSSWLLSNGFILFGKETRGQNIVTIYKKGNDEIQYDGVHWILNGITKIYFSEDIKQK